MTKQNKLPCLHSYMFILDIVQFCDGGRCDSFASCWLFGYERENVHWEGAMCLENFSFPIRFPGNFKSHILLISPWIPMISRVRCVKKLVTNYLWTLSWFLDSQPGYIPLHHPHGVLTNVSNGEALNLTLLHVVMPDQWITWKLFENPMQPKMKTRIIYVSITHNAHPCHPLAISSPTKSHYGLKVTFQKAVRFSKVLLLCEM
jgi:hypothetical protein